MQQANGVIAKLMVKEWYDNKQGRNISLHSFTLDGDRQFYRTGTTPLGHPEGSVVSFQYDPDKGKVDLKTVVVTGKQDAPVASAKPVYDDTSSKKAKDYWKDKDEKYQTIDVPRMSYSAAQDRAIKLLGTAIEQECFSLGQKKGDRLDILLEALDDVTDRFFRQSMNSPQHWKQLNENTRAADVPKQAEDNNNNEGYNE